ncbi:MAG: DmsE family decaheme c-type cytochrome [Acidobacteria bacterium]|nr:DmsE family decaheme c-type cytochrome [Acidobacteriota bacterium]
MSNKLVRLSRKAWWACAILVWLAALVSVQADDRAPRGPEKSAAAQNPPQQSPAAAGPDQYVGNESCLGCHDEAREGYERSLHHFGNDRRTPAADRGCETCHGPNSRHADDPDHVPPTRDLKTLPADDLNAICTTCHSRGEHALWDGSEHERRDVACTACHSMHSAKSEEGFLKGRTEMETCATCHRDKVARQDRSGHMPLREGKLACSSCHNPHGSTNVRLLRTGDSIAETCTSCHADKRGPFLYEHAPSRDGCVTCHDPHGSSNERMLVVKTPMLCQRCHVATRHPSTIYDQALINTSVRVYARSCVTCHANIHGSNHPAGRFFIR